jgi:hypothetical protein
MYLRESERAHILATLDATGWVIGGSKGEVTQLGLKRTTLINRMKLLGIQRPNQRPRGPPALLWILRDLNHRIDCEYLPEVPYLLPF